MKEKKREKRECGFFFCISFTLIKKVKKPSLKALSDIYELTNYRNIRKGPLAGYNWSSAFVNYNGDFDSLGLDRLVKEHIDKFWGFYNIRFTYKIEYKLKRFAIKTSYFGKGNYALKIFNSDQKDWFNTFFKIREQKEYFNGVRNPIFVFLDNIINNKDDFPSKLEYHHFSILKLKNWLQQIKNNDEFDVKPGESMISKRRWRLFNNYMPYNFKGASDSSERKKTKKTLLVSKHLQT